MILDTSLELQPRLSPAPMSDNPTRGDDHADRSHMAGRRLLTLLAILLAALWLGLLVGLTGASAHQQPPRVSGVHHMSDRAILAAAPITVPTTHTLYLPFVTPPGVLYGTVTENGVPAPDVEVALTFCYNFYWLSYSLRCEAEFYFARTDENGVYGFFDMPTLVRTGPDNAHQQHYVVWWRNDNEPDRLASWRTKTVYEYSRGDIYNIGNFDIGGISLVAPEYAAVITAPVTLCWTRRSHAPDDVYGPHVSYYGCFFGSQEIETQPSTPPPPDICYLVHNLPIGYVDSYVLEDLSTAALWSSVLYWKVQVFGQDGGTGYSHECLNRLE